MILPTPNASAVAAVYDRRVDVHAGSSSNDPAVPSTPLRTGFDRRYSILRCFTRLPARALVALIRLYQRTLSPVLPIVTLGRCACRFTPTCSHYAADAIRTHGAFAGAWLALRRLVKCTPLHPGGFDPVPLRATPRCERAVLTPHASRLQPLS